MEYRKAVNEPNILPINTTSLHGVPVYEPHNKYIYLGSSGVAKYIKKTKGIKIINKLNMNSMI